MAWNNPRPYKSPASSPKIEIDPSAPGTAIRGALLAESVLNLFTLPLLTSPRAVLALLVNDSTSITPLACTLARASAALVVGVLTPALILGLPDSRSAIESRRTVYLALGAGEMFLIPLLIWDALGKGDGALTTKTCWGAVSCLLPPVLWRMYCLFVRPELFGRYREASDKEE